MLLYKRPVMGTAYYADFIELKQKEGESPEDFMDRVNQTTRRANPCFDVRQFEHAVVERFVNGNRLDRLRHWAIPKMPTGSLDPINVLNNACSIYTEQRLGSRLSE